MESLSQYLGAAQDVEIWATGTRHDTTGFLLAVAVTVILLLLITYIFIPIGQIVSRQIELAPRTLYGYSWDLAGSLAGILAFFAVSWMALPPWVWFSIIIAGMVLLQASRRDRILLTAAVVPIVILLIDPSTPGHFNLWTPYQQIDVQDFYFPDGDFRGSYIRVNHTGYQTIVNLSPEFLSRHPTLLKEAPDENPYNLPFRLAKPHPRVLIVGSGSGNDVAAALRHQPSAVDAVEIDPKILSRLALYFGTTWQVNGIVIASILSALLLANFVIEKQRQPWSRGWTVAGILAGIVCAYLIPFHRIPGSAAMVGTVAAFAFAIPIFFAGLLFASEFRAVDAPAAALGANMLGAVVGGLLENLSLIIGMKALLLVAAALYALAAVGFAGLPPRANTRPAAQT